MDTTLMRTIEAGLFFLCMFLSGLWLSRSGKPYPGGKFNLHKFIGLGMGIFLIVTVSRAHQSTPLQGIQITAIVINVLCFTVTVAAGGLQSIKKPMPSVVLLLHKWFPYVTVFATAATLSLL